MPTLVGARLVNTGLLAASVVLSALVRVFTSTGAVGRRGELAGGAGLAGAIARVAGTVATRTETRGGHLMSNLVLGAKLTI